MPLIPVAQSLHGKRVFVAGHRGMVGSAIVLHLASERREILTAACTQLDLTRQADVEAWFARTKPQAVFLAAARVGGKADVFDYIERFYNPRRRHSTIGHMSPMQFEQKTRLA